MSRKILICGGGTGGHFFCGLAFAEKFLELEPKSEVHFVGVKRGIEGRFVLKDERMKMHFVESLGFKNVSLLKKIRALGSVFHGCLQAFFLVKALRPDLILGVGGYSSVPGVFAGLVWRLFRRIKVAVIEQNSVAGLANRVFSVLGAQSYSAFQTRGFKTIELPMRHQVMRSGGGERHSNWPPKRLLIMGGSQGALALNRAWLRLLPELVKTFPELEFVHQSGRYGFDEVQSTYQKLNLQAEVFDFSENINHYIQDSDLVISRAGALSLFELMILEKPVVLVPFPQAADNHQLKNAQTVQDPNWIIDQNDLCWERLKPLFMNKDPKKLSWRGGPRASWKEVLQSNSGAY
jgi:UDP-N-acetylglucosamine--N-acetylmuramyl-(pentapeptide) pyrophosphoryl-undecaprenol N-acetylglucosamine transferase